MKPWSVNWAEAKNSRKPCKPSHRMPAAVHDTDNICLVQKSAWPPLVIPCLAFTTHTHSEHALHLWHTHTHIREIMKSSCWWNWPGWCGLPHTRTLALALFKRVELRTVSVSQADRGLHGRPGGECDPNAILQYSYRTEVKQAKKTTNGLLWHHREGPERTNTWGGGGRLWWW